MQEAQTLARIDALKFAEMVLIWADTSVTTPT